MYNTEQKKMLIDYLIKHDGAFSASDIAKNMEEEYGKETPGKSTIYRLLPKLYEEGCVKRFVKEGTKEFLYQAVGGERCHNHLHMKCLACGKLLHMSDKATNALFDEIHDNTDFHMDRENTVLFGLCGKCGHADDRRMK